ncbi:MAG: radical SAM protein [Nitrospirae bacterium]|nr:radical SAM protein [Nitrospirota bacterium]
MCNVWQNPTVEKEEVSLQTLRKIPAGLDYLNLTGGEPTLRRDLMEIADLLSPKAMTFEISSNGLLPERIEPVIKKYPCTKIRFSIEGCEITNNKIRGERGGYQKKINGLKRLKELGGKDIGFGMVLQDDNIEEAVELFHFAKKHGFEFATSALHNGFQFHKSDNVPYDRIKMVKKMEDLVTALLKDYKIKHWFRAYLNLGLMAKMLGQERMLKCTAGTDFVFIDPWSDVYACNVRPDLKMGNLEQQEWDDVLNGKAAKEVREKVSNCAHNCWMVGSAKTAMRHPRYAKLPKAGPLLWVMYNKIKLMLGGKINFQRYLDYTKVYIDEQVVYRRSYLDDSVKRNLQRKDEPHYKKFGEFFNK